MPGIVTALWALTNGHVARLSTGVSVGMCGAARPAASRDVSATMSPSPKAARYVRRPSRETPIECSPSGISGAASGGSVQLPTLRTRPRRAAEMSSTTRFSPDRAGVETYSSARSGRRGSCHRNIS